MAAKTIFSMLICFVTLLFTIDTVEATDRDEISQSFDKLDTGSVSFSGMAYVIFTEQESRVENIPIFFQNHFSDKSGFLDKYDKISLQSRKNPCRQINFEA